MSGPKMFFSREEIRKAMNDAQRFLYEQCGFLQVIMVTPEMLDGWLIEFERTPEDSTECLPVQLALIVLASLEPNPMPSAVVYDMKGDRYPYRFRAIQGRLTVENLSGEPITKAPDTFVDAYARAHAKSVPTSV